MGDTVAGVNYMINDDLFDGGRLLGGLRVKLPTGSENNLTGTGSMDAGAFVAYHHEWDAATLSHMQLGYATYGRRSNQKSLDTNPAWNASVGLERLLVQEYWAFGRVNFSQSPFVKARLPVFYHRDVADLQLGVMKSFADQTWSLGVDVGLSETAADASVHVNWLKLFN